MSARSKYGGDCAATELYVLLSLRITVAKIQNISESSAFHEQYFAKISK